jgi:hypothetical protein
MRRRRPGSVTTFGILNIVFGVLFLLCGVARVADERVEANGKDLSDPLKAYLNSEVPAYTVCRFGSFGVRELLGVGFAVSGIGLLQLQAWGRTLALVCAGVSMGFELFVSIYEIALVNPAKGRFLAGASIVGDFLSGIWSAIAIVVTVVVIAYGVVLLVGLLQPTTARVFRADYVEEPYEEDRPRRRTLDEYDEEDDYRRQRRRDYRDDDDDDDRPRRRPPRRYPDEDDE